MQKEDSGILRNTIIVCSISKTLLAEVTIPINQKQSVGKMYAYQDLT